jgi:hypothetical protein
MHSKETKATRWLWSGIAALAMVFIAGILRATLVGGTGSQVLYGVEVASQSGRWAQYDRRP